MRSYQSKFWAIARMLLIVSLAFSAIFVAFPQRAAAQNEGPGTPTEPEGITDPSIDEIGIEEVDGGALTAKAQQQDAINVIVALNTPDAPEGKVGAYAGAQEALLSAMAGQKMDNVHRYENFPLLAMRVDAAALKRLLASPMVAGVEEDLPNKASLMDSTYIIGASQVKTNYGYDGTGMTVAILDSGVDRTHAFLGGRVVAEACFSGLNGTEPSVSSLCPGGASTYSQYGAGAARPCVVGLDGCEHGTHVAGITAGSGATFNGVAPGANIIAVNVFSNASGNLVTYDSDFIKGLDYVYSLRSAYTITSVNMSLGGGGYTKYCDKYLPATKAAIDRLRKVNIATIIATGNNGYINGISRPACVSSAISVGSTTKSDSVSYFSNSASFMALLAPGSDIYSSVPGGGFETMSGTSMATPHVTGAWAVMRQVKPSYKVPDILSLLKSTGVAVKDYRNKITKPRISLSNAVSKLNKVKPTEAPVLVAPIGGAMWDDSTVALTWKTVFPANRYKVVVKLGTKTVINAFFNASADVCSLSGDCSVHIPTILKTGTFTWTVQGYAVAGPGPVSAPATFMTPMSAPGGITLVSPITQYGYYPTTFQWDEDAAPYASVYKLEAYRGTKKIISKSYTATSICTGHSCFVPSSVALTEGDYTWTVTPSNPVGLGTPVTGNFGMHAVVGYSNHFDSTLAGMTILYPFPGWWWMGGSNLYTWLGANHTVATAKINAIYGNIDYTVVVRRTGDAFSANIVYINGVPTLTGSIKDWKTSYRFQYTNDGHYSVYKVISGKVYALQSWTTSPYVLQGGVSNTLRVVSYNGNMSFFINGTKVWSGVDTAPGGALKPGAAGVGSYLNLYVPSDWFYIDSVQTSNPSGPAAVEEDEISAEQQSLNEIAMKEMKGSPAGPNISMEEYLSAPVMPDDLLPQLFLDKQAACIAAGLPDCPQK